ncbi:MAG: hypothetical protein Kow0098_03170 [Ignavibacteriaceae bacterium]
MLILESKKNNEIRYIKDIRQLSEREKEKALESSYYFEPLIPDLPVWTNRIYYYKKFRQNLFNLTCTCPQFDEKKGRFNARDVRSICSHIFIKLKSTRVNDHVPRIMLLLAQSAIFYNSQYFFRTHINNVPVYYGFAPHTNWINIFAPSLDNDLDYYVRYGYNPVDKRWADGMDGWNADKVLHVLNHILLYALPYEHNSAKIDKILNKQ